MVVKLLFSFCCWFRSRLRGGEVGPRAAVGFPTLESCAPIFEMGVASALWRPVRMGLDGGPVWWLALTPRFPPASSAGRGSRSYLQGGFVRRGVQVGRVDGGDGPGGGQVVVDGVGLAHQGVQRQPAHERHAGHVLPDFRRQLLLPHAVDDAGRAAILQGWMLFTYGVDDFVQQLGWFADQHVVLGLRIGIFSFLAKCLHDSSFEVLIGCSSGLTFILSQQVLHFCYDVFRQLLMEQQPLGPLCVDSSSGKVHFQLLEPELDVCPVKLDLEVGGLGLGVLLVHLVLGVVVDHLDDGVGDGGRAVVARVEGLVRAGVVRADVDVVVRPSSRVAGSRALRARARRGATWRCLEAAGLRALGCASTPSVDLVDLASGLLSSLPGRPLPSVSQGEGEKSVSICCLAGTMCFRQMAICLC